jgi:streptogramin lyase
MKTQTYDLPTKGAVVRNMSLDTSRGRLWLALSGTGRLGRIDYAAEKLAAGQ